MRLSIFTNNTCRPAPGPGFIRRISLSIAICAFGFLPAAVGAALPAPLFGELSASDQQKVLGGQQVLVTNNIEGMAWPETIVFRKFSVSPETVASAFTDYAHMTEINPTVISASLVRESGADQVIAYTTKVPVLKQVTYTVINHISRESGGVTIRWMILRSSCASSGNGEIVIEPMAGGSVLKYESKVTPSFPGASLLRSAAVNQSSDTINSVAAYLERTAMR